LPGSAASSLPDCVTEKIFQKIYLSFAKKSADNAGWQVNFRQFRGDFALISP
jgi:hypothetical protein